MKETRGFLTNDGTFFVDEKEAILHEKERQLRERLAREFPRIEQEGFFHLLITVIEELREYIDAYNAATPHPDSQVADAAESEVGEEAIDSTPPEAHVSSGHVSAAEEDIAPLLKLKVRRPRNVSDVGRGTQSKKVPDGSPLDGP